MKATVIYMLGELFNKLAPFLFLPYITHTLGAEDYGKLAYIQTLAVLIAIPIGLSQQAYIRKMRFSSSDIEQSELFSSIMLHNILVSLFLFFILHFFVSDSVYVALVAFFQVLISTILTVMQCEELPRKYVKSQIIYTTFTLLFTFVFLEFSQDYTSRLTAIIFSGGVSCVFMLFSLRSSLILKIMHFKNLDRLFFVYKSFFYFGVLLLLSQVSFYIRSQFERYVIQYKFSSEELGVYMLSFQVASIALLVSNALLLAFQPRILRYLKENSINSKVINNIRLSFFYPIVFFVAISFFSNLIPSEWVAYIFGKEFEGMLSFAPQMVASFSIMLPIGICTEILVYLGRNNLVSKISLLSTIIYVPIVILFSKMSLYSIPYGMLISNVIQLFMLFYCIKKEGLNS